MSQPWPENAFPTGVYGYPLPDWDSIADWVEASHPPEAWHKIYCEAARDWVSRIRKRLGDGYSIHESDRFILLSRVDKGRAVEVLRFLERIDLRVRDTIPELLPEALYGKCPVLVFAGPRDFYEYVSEYVTDDGAFGGIGGIYLNRGFGHFAMPSEDLARYAAVMSHELCHAYLAHLELPLWLDEAITQGVEQSITGGIPYVLDRETIRRHQDYWDEAGIREFWAGRSFYYADDGQELSYHLARFILHALHRGGNTPREAMNRFFLNARHEDTGQSAALEVLGISLGDCVGSLLGKGDWEPFA